MRFSLPVTLTDRKGHALEIRDSEFWQKLYEEIKPKEVEREHTK